MKKYSTLLVAFLFFGSWVSAQLVNQGGTITIQENAKLIVQSDISNTTGSIVNNGTIEVEGNFTNGATYTAGTASKVVFKGDMNSDLTSGGATFREIENNKTAGDVILIDDASVSGAVNFSGTSDIVLGMNDFKLADGATSNGSADGHFVTEVNGGDVIQEVSADGLVEIDLGDGTRFTPLSLTTSTGDYEGGTKELRAKVVNADHPELLGDADDYISRYWEMSHDIAGTPSVAWEGTFDVTDDVNGTVGDMVGARYEGTEWNFGSAAAAGTTVGGSTDELMSELTGMNFYGKANVKVFLEGAYNASNDNMNTSLNGLIPTTSPYADAATHSLSPLPSDIVDWIEVEYIDGANSVRKSAFVKNDGVIVDLDGLSPVLLKDSPAAAKMNIYHQSHLPIGTQNDVDLSNPSSVYDATILANIYNNSSIATDNVKELEPGVYGLFRGNGTSDTNLNFLDYIIVRNNTTTSVPSIYSQYDTNMDGNLNFIDYILSRQNATTSKPAHLNQ